MLQYKDNYDLVHMSRTNQYHSSIRGSNAAGVAGSIEHAIRSGTLPPGHRLPTVRGLATHLGLSPTTVSAAYQSLRNRGLIVSAGRRGTAVSPRPPIALPAPAAASELPAHVLNLADGNPDPSLLPSIEHALRTIDSKHTLYGEPLIDPELARLALKQFREDGIPATSVAVVGGALDGLERVLTCHLRPGDRVAVEDPAFTGVLDLLAALGLSPVPVPIDDSGLLPDALAKTLATGVAALIVTPRAQNPFGAALDEPRRRALRRVLSGCPNLLLFEDDHAGNISGAPALSLVDRRRERWAVARSVSKSLGPDIRLAVLAGDATTLARVEGRQVVGMRWVSHFLQRLVVAQWKNRSVEAKLRRAERAYSERRAALIEALAEHGIRAHGRTGLNVWVPVVEEGRLVQGLRERGFAVSSGERFRLDSPPGVRICVARLEPSDARRLADALAALAFASPVATT